MTAALSEVTIFCSDICHPYQTSLYKDQPRFKTTKLMSVLNVNFIPRIRLLKSGGGVLMPLAWINRPIIRVMPGIVTNHQGAPFNSRQAIRMMPKGTYSAKFPWARIALSRSSCPPLPKPIWFFLLKPITAKESLIKMIVRTEATIEVTNSI